MAAPSTTRLSHRLRIFGALRHRNYRLYWFSQLASVGGFRMLIVTLAWQALDETESALFMGLVGAGPLGRPVLCSTWSVE